jgi:hypothetical protein
MNVNGALMTTKNPLIARPHSLSLLGVSLPSHSVEMRLRQNSHLGVSYVLYKPYLQLRL